MKELKIKKSVFNTKNIDTAINRAKKHLKEYVSKNGIYENFGIEYYTAIKDQYIDICDYSINGKAKMRALSSFIEWCRKYTPAKGMM